jgi:hypothetical protein
VRQRAFTALAEAARPAPSVRAAGLVRVSTATERSGVQGWGVGRARLAPVDWAPPLNLWSREAAMSVPTISRARDLVCSTVGQLPLTLWTLSFDPATAVNVEQQIPPALWMARPDTNRTRQWLLAWTADDLFFLGRAYWHITNRYVSTYPASFERMPAADVGIDANGRVTWNGRVIPNDDVVEFLSSSDGLLYCGARAINTAQNLDAAAERFSTTEIPAGWLAQRPDSEPLDADELGALADNFQAARLSRSVAALNPYLEWHESAMDPSKLQLTEARQHQALELARVANVPAYLVGAPTGGGMTYTNATQAKSDLLDFGCLPIVATIEQTLSGPNVTPSTQFVRLATDAWLRSPLTTGTPSPNDAQIAYNAPPAPVPPPRAPGRPRNLDGLNEGTPAP